MISLLKLTKMETFTIISYLEIDFQKNNLLIAKLMRYAQNRGWKSEVKKYLEDKPLYLTKGKKK